MYAHVYAVISKLFLLLFCETFISNFYFTNWIFLLLRGNNQTHGRSFTSSHLTIIARHKQFEVMSPTALLKLLLIYHNTRC